MMKKGKKTEKKTLAEMKKMRISIQKIFTPISSPGCKCDCPNDVGRAESIYSDGLAGSLGLR